MAPSQALVAIVALTSSVLQVDGFTLQFFNRHITRAVEVRSTKTNSRLESKDTRTRDRGRFVPREKPESPEDARTVKVLAQELIIQAENSFSHNAMRTYKKLRKLGGYPDSAGYTAILGVCVRENIPQVVDHIIADMFNSPPADGIKLSDLKLALEACSKGSRPKEAVNILDFITKVGARVI
jgi:hypothetical protein